jgi:hypothetical protein
MKTTTMLVFIKKYWSYAHRSLVRGSYYSADTYLLDQNYFLRFTVETIFHVKSIVVILWY